MARGAQVCCGGKDIGKVAGSSPTHGLCLWETRTFVSHKQFLFVVAVPFWLDCV
jgi:hypothetical protein